ncbi:hypothetical protein [Laceyella sacchari]|uniref:Uncharacterized protein n=1 Tax=Laceyella sacchari TaxID=37482 RepID=A0ABY5U0H8_LACSH|nr:hypothetical protein [Laceyella sacchari]UWE02978.1 hypothetical protein NYR52_12715 [Laceyella sacchari]
MDGCGDSGDDGVENGERRDPDSIHSGFGRACPLFHHHHGVDAGRVWTRPYCVTGRQFWTEKIHADPLAKNKKSLETPALTAL